VQKIEVLTMARADGSRAALVEIGASRRRAKTRSPSRSAAALERSSVHDRGYGTWRHLQQMIMLASAAVQADKLRSYREMVSRSRMHRIQREMIVNKRRRGMAEEV